jgi:hypothetical protein
MDTVAAQPPAGISELHMDPPEPSPWLSDSLMTGELPGAAIDAVVEAIGPGSGSQLVSVEMRHCGGAFSRAAEGSGALAKLPGSFLNFAVGIVPVPEALAPTRAWIDAFTAALAPYDAGRYLNFCDERFDLAQAFPEETLVRLCEVKDRYDPDNVFQANHPLTG